MRAMLPPVHPLGTPSTPGGEDGGCGGSGDEEDELFRHMMRSEYGSPSFCFCSLPSLL